VRWEHEEVLEAVQRRLDLNPGAMRQRREVVEHPFGRIKLGMGATPFLMKTLLKVASEMALHVLAYNLTRVLNILGIQPLMATLRAKGRGFSRVLQPVTRWTLPSEAMGASFPQSRLSADDLEIIINHASAVHGSDICFSDGIA
jgi:hypothetical protein